MIDRELLFSGVVIRDDRARLQRHGGVAAEAEGVFHHDSAVLECGLHLAALELQRERHVAAELRVDDVGALFTRSIDVGNHRKLVVLHIDQLGGILGDGAGASDDGGDRLPGPDHLVCRQRELRRRLHVVEVIEGADPRLAQLRQIFTGRHQMNALDLQRRTRIDRKDLRMGIGTAHECRIQHAWQFHIGNVAPLACQQPLGIGTRDRAADIAVRAIELAERLLHDRDLIPALSQQRRH